MHPGPVVFKLEGGGVGDGSGSSQQSWSNNRRDLLENPHCVVREHLEFLVEGQKSILPMCRVSFILNL